MKYNFSTAIRLHVDESECHGNFGEGNDDSNFCLSVYLFIYFQICLPIFFFSNWWIVVGKDIIDGYSSHTAVVMPN